MLAPAFAAVGVASVPLLAATTALCLSIEAVRVSLSNKESDQIATPRGSAIGGNSNGTSPSSGY